MASKNPVVHIENRNGAGGTYLQGEPNEMILALIGAMQANKFVRVLFERAVFLANVADKKGWDVTKNHAIDVGDEADEAFKKFVDPNYKKKGL